MLDNFNQTLTDFIHSELKTLGLIIAAIALWALIAFLKKRAAVRLFNSDHNIVASMKSQLTLQSRISELLAKLGASRVHVYLFHNGSHYINNSTILKFSCKAETCAIGDRDAIQDYQDIKISTMTEYFGFLCTGDSGEYNTEETYTEDFHSSYIRSTLKSQNVHSVIRCPLYKGEEIVGVIAIHCKDTTRKKATSDCKKASIVKNYAHHVEYIVNKDPLPPKSFLTALKQAVETIFSKG